MRLNILIAGHAGQGINEISNILAKSLASAGFYVFNYRNYGSYITGGHNFNILSVSDKKIHSYEEDFDVVIALNEDAIKKHKIKEKAIVLASEKYKIKNLVLVNVENEKIENVYFAAALCKILGLEKEILKEYINKVFAGKSLLKEDLEAVDLAYRKDYGFDLKLNGKAKEKHVFTGTEAIGIAAIESGLQVYYAYPMTPSTPLLSFLAGKQEKYDYLVYQPENEIAVINAALGSSFANAISMVGTSGGGFDLMTEALSMAGMAELPLVVYLASRPGPSTGIPTYSMQQDINLAVYSGHGEFPRIVVCPGDIEDSYRLTKEVFYLTQKYRTPGIILTDKHLAESYFTIEKLEEYKLPEIKLGKVLGKELIKTSSYEHDEKGNTIEDAFVIKRRFEARLKKKEEIKEEARKFETFQIYGNKNSKKVIVAAGSVKGAIIDALAELKNYKLVFVKYLEPFADIEKEIKGREIFVIEENSTGMLADLIQKNLGVMIPAKNRILKYDARQFTAEEVVRRISK